MSKVVWKYDLEIETYQTIEIPEHATFLHIDVQNNNPKLWLLVDPENPKSKVNLVTLSTGQPTDLVDDISYLGTYLLNKGTFVGHVFIGKVK